MKLVGLLIVMMISTACEQSLNLEALDELTNSSKTSSNKKINSGSSTATDKSGSKQASDKSGLIQKSDSQEPGKEVDKSGSIQSTDSKPIVNNSSEYILFLEDYGVYKIQAIKLVRSITGIGLQEAKDLVESAPVKIISFESHSEAESVSNKFKDLGIKTRIIDPNN